MQRIGLSTATIPRRHQPLRSVQAAPRRQAGDRLGVRQVESPWTESWQGRRAGRPSIRWAEAVLPEEQARALQTLYSQDQGGSEGCRWRANGWLIDGGKIRTEADGMGSPANRSPQRWTGSCKRVNSRAPCWLRFRPRPRSCGLRIKRACKSRIRQRTATGCLRGSEMMGPLGSSSPRCN